MKCGASLLSLTKIAKKGMKVIIQGGIMKIIDEDNENILTGKMNGNVYEMNIRVVQQKCFTSIQSSHLVHQRLGHCGKHVLDKLREAGEKIDNKDFVCESCIAGKMVMLPSPKTNEQCEPG